MKVLALVAFALVSTQAFAVSPACERVREKAQTKYHEVLADIKAGVKAEEISKKDAEMYIRNAALILVQAEATCASYGEFRD